MYLYDFDESAMEREEMPLKTPARWTDDGAQDEAEDVSTGEMEVEKTAVGITMGHCPVDIDLEWKASREAHFPLRLLDAGVCFSCQAGEATVVDDKQRIMREIGDNAETLNNLCRGVVAAPAVERALRVGGVTRDGVNRREAYLQAAAKGCWKVVNIDLRNGQADDIHTWGAVLDAAREHAVTVRLGSQLPSFPDALAALERIEHLDLTKSGCLERLPDEIGNLNTLKELLMSCSRLQQFPHSLFRLASIESLQLEGIHTDTVLSEELGNLSTLTDLSISSHIDGLDGNMHRDWSNTYWSDKPRLSLPESLGNLSRLTALSFSGEAIRVIPESIANLSMLQTLSLSFARTLVRLPSNIGNLRALKRLDMHCCYGITALPESFSGLSALEYLSLRGCGRTGRIANEESLGELVALQTLRLDENSKLPKCASQRLKENGCRLVMGDSDDYQGDNSDDDTPEPSPCPPPSLLHSNLEAMDFITNQADSELWTTDQRFDALEAMGFGHDQV